MTAIVILIVSAIVSGVGVGLIRRHAIQRQIIDFPNERSSHSTPTPRGGGLSIVIVVLIGTLALAISANVPWNVAGAIIVGGFVALIGYIDDRGDLSPLTRGIAHLVSAIVGLALLGGMPTLDLGFTVLEWGLLGHVVGVVGIVWMTNLYNFMDGIDGLAASEAVFVFGVGGILLASSGLTGLALLCALTVGSSIGFLRWNWPPAKIFMGDVGSGFLGYLIAIVAIASGNQGFSLWVWLILVAAFFVDATVTLIRRVLRGEKWYSAHRSHAYQHLTQNWGSHLKVTLTVIALNLLWLGGLATLATIEPSWTLGIVTVALLPLIVLAIMLRAGKEIPIYAAKPTR